ncbi:MAG: hypothetical protein QME83_10320 [Thermodesulfobacteriota bacterium]|nr:hypothetical protein [Thermodesulfobacteriota bacterium]
MALIGSKIAILAICLFFSGIGCRSDDARPLDPVVPAISLDELSTAPEVIEVARYRYVLQTYLWRDLMPISPLDGHPLIALIRVVERDLKTIPEGVKLNYLWVINRKEVWATTFSDEPRPPTPSYMLERVGRGGPKWGPHIQVNVVVGLRMESGKLRLLRAADQWIHRTD